MQVKFRAAVRLKLNLAYRRSKNMPSRDKFHILESNTTW
jgi:hypothetical protein